MSTSSEDKYIGESGRPFSLPSSPTAIQPSSDNTTYQQILANANSFFNSNVNKFDEHNRFFEQFIPEWVANLKQGNYIHAGLIWESVLNNALSWEKSVSNRIHKGAPYYYWGVTCLLKEDLEKGFMLIHQALEEDKKSVFYIKFQNTPSYAFVTLDYQRQKQFVYDKVKDITLFLGNQLNRYRKDRSSSLKLADVKSKLLSTSDPSLLDIVFDLIFDLFHSYKIFKEYDQNLTNNTFGFRIMANVIFSLCLVIDNLNTHKNPKLKGQRFPVVINPLISKATLTLKQNIMQEFNAPFQTSFPNTVGSLVTSTAVVPNMPLYLLSPIEEDLIIAYGFRNFGAHRIESQPIINTYFKQILERIFNVLFLTIEFLY